MIDRSVGHVFSWTKAPKRWLVLIKMADFTHAKHDSTFTVADPDPIKVAGFRHSHFESVKLRAIVYFSGCTCGAARLKSNSSFRYWGLRQQVVCSFSEIVFREKWHAM